nr:reverse transcriptase domain-containing protein [Tanacetum cinerariifolium]
MSTQDQKPQRKAGSGSKFSSNNLTMKLNLSKFQSLGTIFAQRSKPKPSKVKCQSPGTKCVNFSKLQEGLKLPKSQSSRSKRGHLVLKELPPHLEYAFLGDNGKWPVIIAKDLSSSEKTALINVLKTRKKAIAWKLTDIRGIDLEFCSHKILLEEDYSPKVQSQRRVNPKIYDVIKKEVEKLLDAGLIYPISDSPWEAKRSYKERSFPTSFHGSDVRTSS